MKAMIYSASWCAACKDMADFLKQQYPDVTTQFVPIDQLPAEVQAKIMGELRKLTWSDQLPVTLLDDTVVLGADYAALIAMLGPGGKPPASGRAQHRHGLVEAGA